jgi:hypothetical protein
MKKMIKENLVVIILVFFGLVALNYVSAHPGNTDSSGCHTCRTNCLSWGLSYGEYHCHQSSGFSNGYSSIPSCPSMSIYDFLSDSCKCYTGYVAKGNSCVSLDSACQDDYGYGSQFDSILSKCKCKYGYIFGNDILGKTKCITTTEYCHDKYGFNSLYSSLSDSCECSSGYILSLKTIGNGYECISCFSKYGLHSSYNYLSKTCECNSNYTLNDQNQCVEKQNNVYFTLKELKTDSKEAVIKSDYDFQYYHITYGIGCFDGAFSRYLNNKIVVNLGTDFNLDTWDKIVLQSDNETCNIVSKERVASNFTLFPKTETISNTTPNIANLTTNISSLNKKENIPGYSLVKTSGNSDIYAVYANTKRKIRSIDTFNSYDWTNQKVATVSQASLDSISDTKLIKTPDNPNVYILEKGFKRVLASVEIFNSYGLDWNKVVTMNQKEMDSYQIAPLIKYLDTYYWLDTQRVQHMFPSTESLAINGYSEKDAIIVNSLELGSYGEGIKINK